MVLLQIQRMSFGEPPTPSASDLTLELDQYYTEAFKLELNAAAAARNKGHINRCYWLLLPRNNIIAS
jgi:hypothetical protein